MKEMNEIHLKFVDDLTLAETITMKDQLTDKPSRPRPDNYHARTGQELKPENSKVYRQLELTKQYAVDNGMKLNLKKTKLMLFNPAKSLDFMPTFNINNEEIELVEETKLLGLVIRSDLSWQSNTECMIRRCNSKLWILRRLKRLGATQEDLLDIYKKQVRSILEYAVPVWHSAITVEQSVAIERVQKTAFHIILGHQYKSYDSALKTLNMDTLNNRRTKLCNKFAKKSVNNSKFSKWFKINKKVKSTRNQFTKYCKVYCRTNRYEKSPISYLTNLLNS